MNYNKILLHLGTYKIYRYRVTMMIIILIYNLINLLFNNNESDIKKLIVKFLIMLLKCIKKDHKHKRGHLGEDLHVVSYLKKKNKILIAKHLNFARIILI